MVKKKTIMVLCDSSAYWSGVFWTLFAYLTFFIVVPQNPNTSEINENFNQNFTDVELPDQATSNHVFEKIISR